MSGIQQGLMASYKTASTPVTIYTYTSTNNNTGFNNNAASDFYAFSFTPTASGIPTEIVLRMQSITGTPTGNIKIKADKTQASTTYAEAGGITFTSGTNTIALTGGTSLSSGTTYWVLFERTSNTSNYFRIYNEYASPPTEQLWISTASNIDPNTRYDSGSKNIGISMDLNGTT